MQIETDAVVTASGNSSSFSALAALDGVPWLREGERDLHRTLSEIALAVAISDVTGTTPTLDIEVQWSPDDGTTWISADPADTLAQFTAAGSVVVRIPAKATTARLAYTVGGTLPSFTVNAWVEAAG